MNRIAFKFAASTMIVSLTLAGATTQSIAMRRPAAAAANDPAGQAAQFNEQGRSALQQGQLPQAMEALEQAVALSPRDAGYRLLLADIYLKSGRFEAARATYADVLELDPAHVRAGLTYALTQIALGRPQAAVAQLDELDGRAPAADVGLAYALAGMPERAVEILEPAARSPDATPRIRQNLALSYALAGNWQRARAVAAQDISPVEMRGRMEQWAALARPDAAPTRVAALLGVIPVQDAGQPVRLALSQPAAEPMAAPAEAFAEAAPATDSDWGVPPAAEVQVAEAPTYYTPAPEAPAAQNEEEATYALAAQGLTEPSPPVIRAAAAALPPAPVFQRAAPVAEVRSGNSRFVVQLGAFSNEGNAERAWQQAEGRFGLGEHQPLTTTFEHQGRTLHRVSIAGFAGRTEAAQLCGAIRAQGGACFVRGNAGDAAVRWAARYAPDRNRDA